MAGKGSGRLHARTNDEAVADRWPFAAPEREWNREPEPAERTQPMPPPHMHDRSYAILAPCPDPTPAYEAERP